MYAQEWLGDIKPAPAPTVHKRERLMLAAEKVWAERDRMIDHPALYNQEWLDEWAAVARILEGVALGSIEVSLQKESLDCTCGRNPLSPAPCALHEVDEEVIF